MSGATELTGGSPKRFAGKAVLVTGGHTGIGLAVARRFAREGAALVLVGRDAEKGAAAASELTVLGAACRFLSADLISTLIDQNPSTQSRMPRDMMRQGWSASLFHASQQCATMSS